MAQFAPCFIPKFGSTFHCPKSPVAIRAKAAPAQNIQLLSAWRHGRLGSLLQTTWALVLRCYTNSEDICFGYQHVEVDGPQQCSDPSNMSTVRLAVDDGDSVKVVVGKIERNATIGTSSETCKPDYRLFNTTLMLRNYCNSTNSLPPACTQPVLAITLPDECRIRLHVKVLQGEVGIFLEWWNHDMSMEHMKSLADVFEGTLTRVLSEDDVPVGNLDHFTDKDWRRICKWNSSIPENYERCIHEVIHEQSLIQPEKEAVCAWDGSLTYSELDRLASTLACYLQTHGVGPEVRVALCFDKSKWNTVAMLGVLKAGGAFVPLDPAHPADRLRNLTIVIQARIMICSSNHAEHLASVAKTLLPLDDGSLDSVSTHFRSTSPLPEVESHNAAYVLFTSGSTGEPKGVLVEHRAFCSSAVAHAGPFRIDSHARVLQFAAHTFDASLVDILTPLMHGGCVCVPSESARLNDIVNAINDMRVNHACLTPSFIEFIDPSSVPGVETVILAGEAMSPSHITAWSNRYLVNGYGPTESSVAATVNPGMTAYSDCRDIGFAVGIRPWIVDPEDHNQLVPVGCAGELLLEGPTLARGYVNNQRKTDEVFIYDPTWSKSATSGTRRRFYKTGDLVRYSSDDGCLAYIGRKDTQVKLHGQRIELGEIENHLSADATVKHCSVLFPNSGFSKGKIVAVVSLTYRNNDCDEHGPVTFRLVDEHTRARFVTEARQRLSARLPRHMIPTVWLCLEALPFLTSGKLDRKSVASWVSSMENAPSLQVAGTYSGRGDIEVQPVSEVEEQLLSIWSRILNIPLNRISPNDSFLSLGGDSIAAITCTSSCKKHGIGLTVQDILHSKSIRELASRAKTVTHAAVYQETVEEPFDLSPIQKLHFLLRKEGQGHFNQSILTRMHKNVEVKHLRRAIETLVMRHSMLRARFTDTSNDAVRQRITQDIAGSFHWGIHHIKGREDVKQRISESQSRMNSISGPVLAVDLFNTDGEAPLLFMVAHHLVVDIVSWRIILEDLEELLMNPDQSVPQNPPLPFQTWCRLQAGRLETDNTERLTTAESLPDPDLAYWGMERTPILYGDAACETFELDSESTSLILRDCHECLRTEPVDLFLATLLHAFAQTFQDRASPVVYNEGHGREVWESAIDISRTVGWFTTLSPIFISDLDLSNPRASIIRVKDLRRRVSDNGREDFARRMLSGNGNECSQPYPMEISFNYVGQHRDLQRQDGLFQLAEQMAGEASQGGGPADFGETTPRFALFETSAMVVEGRLRFNFSFNRFMRHQKAIRDWITRCRDLLTSTGEQLRDLTPQPTLSDFPMLSLTYESLEAMTAQKLPRFGVESLDLIEDIYPCSRLQQSVILNHLRDTSLYIVHATFEVRGNGDAQPTFDRLKLAWQKVVSHHAMLRTIFVENLTERDLFSQVVLKTFDSPPTYLQCANDDHVLQTLDKLPSMDHRQHKPVHRFTVCQTDTGKLFCRLQLSHAVMDGVSISIILRDLQLAYSETLSETRKPLFKDFMRCLQNSPQQASIDYWCSYLDNIKPCNFPVLNDGRDSPRQLQCLRLDFGLFKELRKFSEASGITLSTAFNVAWGLTLSSYCGSDEVCFGYMVSLRDLPVEEIKSVVGPVINLAACRMKLSGNSMISDVLHQAQNDYMESLPYRHSSLIDIQHALKLPDTTLFNSGVSYQKLPSRSENNNADIKFVEACSIHDPAEFPVFVNVEVTDDDAQVELNYWTTTLSDGQAENLASTFLQSLKNIALYGNSEICRLDSLSDRNKEQIRVWNNNLPEDVDECIPEIFDRWAKSRPDAAAIATSYGSLTYSELNELSSRLAAYLTMLGVDAGVYVPIDVEKSRWTVISIMAVFKVGGICLPLNGYHSQAYLDQWLDHNEIRVCLVSPNRAQLLEGTVPYVVTVDNRLLGYLPATEVQDCPSRFTSAAGYVVFAADNSDDPQCVTLDHRAILARAQNFSYHLQLHPETRLLQYSACTSDLFLQEVLGTFLHGGCVCLTPDGPTGQVSALAKQLQANFLSVPSSTADRVNLSDIPELDGAAFSGERSAGKAGSICATNIRIHTLYGAPECSSTCINNSVNEASDGLQNVRSTAGCISWVADPLNHNRLVPIGCIGELVIEGPMLARGYFEDTQSESNFIEDPEWLSTLHRETSSSNDEVKSVAATPKRRMFKTGSLVRYNSDGSLVYVGKKSGQTKRRSLFAASCSSEADVAYWREYLADIEPCCFPSLCHGSANGEMCVETLSLKHAADLHTFSRTTGVPSCFVLQIAWGLVLRCYTGSEDVCFAYSSSKKALMCRLSLRDNISIEKALGVCKADFDKGIHHHVPLGEVQNELGIEDGMSPINTALDCCENSRPDEANFPAIGRNSTQMNNSSRYRIVVNADICHDSVNICFSYSSDSLSNDQIKDVVDCFEHIVDSIIHTKPGSVIGDLDFFTERTCERVREWNSTLPERFEKCAHEIIKDQALALPSSASAICAWNGNFTYLQLDIMSSRLAHKLTELGVEPEAFVALCFEKSTWAVVAQLAVLKAGGAFAALDPSHPDARLRGLSDDMGAHIIMCSRKHHGRASKICNIALVVDESAVNGLPNPPPNTPLIRPSPDNAAYGIFTSGTTGKPKLTVVEHIALATASVGLARTLNMDTKSRALQFSSYTFDVSVLETILTLMTGGCICIPSDEERMNDLSGAIRKMKANFISVPPGITNTLEPKNVPSLTTIITGGEKITPSHIERWSDRCVINAYGPSESTIVATASVKIDRERNRVNDDSNSIGVALCGRTWVVDPHNHHRLVPVGAVGELVLEGSNVARGYLNNERKTSEVFVQDPEWTRHIGLQDVLRRKERMYRTGDLVRYNPDGTLTFISRRDTQIKFNGQRIELEEIENQCIRYLPKRTQLAVDVVVPESKVASKGLAVFFTVDVPKHQDISSEALLIHMSKSIRDILNELQVSLTETLPLNMIPKYFFPVRHLPFTTAGKLDRKGLLAMAQSLPKNELRAYIPSSSVGSTEVTEGGIEGTLRSLWEKVLDLTPGSVSMEDSFFGLGGDSYSAMSLVGAAQAHGISLSVADIFKYPLFTDMAQSCGVSTQSHHTTLAPFSVLPDSVKLDDALDEVADQCRVAKDSIADVYPCSAVQEGLLTLSIKQRGAYIAQPAFRLADSVDIERFKAAWQKTVDQLDILRTRIAHTETSNFLQVVLRKAPIPWTSAKSLDQLPGDTLELPKHNGGLLTSYAIIEPDSFCARYFVWTAHHALYDGWTVPLILRRVEENYSDSLPGNSTVPYGLFIDYLSKRDMSNSDQFWTSYLSNLSSVPFPQNKHPLPNAARAGNSHQNTMDISSHSTNTGLTLPVLIRAAWAIVVSTHTGSGDVCFGETLMGRNIDLPGISEIAGPALTTVPTRVQVDNGLTIPQYLQNVHQVTAEMIPHQHSGLQRIRKLGSDAALACEFQNLLVIQSDDGQLDQKIWTAEDNQASEEFFTHPLVIECKISESKMQTTVHHDEIVVESWMAQKLIDQFSFVLSQLLEMPKDETRRLSELDVFSRQDMEQVAQWNSREPFTVDKCIHDLVLERSSLHPNATAVCGWDGQLSYQELCTASASFARYLISRGIGPEVIVPICLDKTIWVPVTILSILMAGGAFLPMDPTHPTSRHEEILAELDANILLCSPHYCNRYSSAVKTVIPINRDTIKAYGALNQHARLPNITASSMAYTLFTSGSSGRAKGIVTQHRAVVSSVMAFSPVVQLDSASRVFQFASLTFDAAMLELFATMLFGGCICIPSETERLNDVAGAIRRMNVSWTFLTPAIASIIEPSSTPSLKVIACGGEAVPPEVVTKWINSVKLFIAYGPTETTIFATVNADLSSNRDPACIGHGIPCTLTWVVDPENHNRLAPLGSVGELALEGPALAREYLKNPQKTTESFIDEPAWAAAFSPVGSCHRRIYKTGDLVRYNSDGSLEYFGRKDHQVKLHGLRMELGEIEFRLKENARVRHAVVVLPKSGLLQKRLVTVLSLNSLSSEADIVSDRTCELADEHHLINCVYPELVEIQRSLESQLPIYMVPQTWAVIKKIPMLVSDKTDRKTITNWVENVDESVYDRIMQDYDKIKRTKAQGPVKEDEGAGVKILQNIFAHVLNLPSHKINATRSFVSLGGDSITGMAVVSRARKQGFSLTLHDVLQSKSLEDLVDVAGSSIQASKHQEATGEYFGLSPIQGLYLRSSNGVSPDARFNQGMTLRVSRRVEPDAIKQAVKAVVSQHSMLRARFNVSQAGEWQQRITEEIGSSYRLRVHSVNDDHEATSKIGQSQRCLDIQNGPILAADLFDVRGSDQILFLVASHLCVDMVSWRIILQDIQEFIDSGSLAPEKHLSFKAWCELQMEHSRENKNRSQIPFAVQQPNLRYWGMEGVPNVYGDIKTESFTLDEQTTGFIFGKCNETLRTEVPDILLSAVIHSFQRVFTDRSIPTLYNEGHGRESWDSNIDLSRTVGWFTALCPIGVDLNSDNILETVKRVKDTRRKIPANGRPYFAQSLLHPDAKSRSRDFLVPLEILFNYLGRLQQLERGDSLFQSNGDIFSDKNFDVTGDMGRQTSRFSLFEISAIIVKEELHVSFTYSRNMQRERQIHQWISECKHVLEKGTELLKNAVPEFTLSDYPLLPITYDGLKSLTRDTLPRAGITSKNQVEDIYPCSPMQEGILLSQLRDPNSYMFHVVFEVKNPEAGRVVSKRLEEAWQMVVDRHSILRTVFIDSNYKGGSFDQLVLGEVNDNVLAFECDDSDALERLESVKLRELNDRRMPKISHQLAICKTFTERVLIKLEISHAIIDGGSVDVLLRDFALAYNQQLPKGQGPRYSGYIEYIRTRAQDQDLAHWKHYMNGVSPCHLSFDNEPEPSRQLKSIKMDFDRFFELQQFCEKNSVTLANLTLSAWAIVLRRFTESDDVCFGYPSAGRDAPVPGIQEAVGIFINMLCCRVKFAPGQTLTDISKMVQDDYISSLPHQSCSLASIQHELGLEGQALFNTTLSIQNHSKPADSRGGFLTFDLQKAYDPSEYPVTVNVETARGREGILLRYWTDALSETQAKGLADAIAQVFTRFIEKPSEPISEMDVHGKALQVNALRSRRISQATVDYRDNSSLKRLIDDRVNEVISQMLKDGKLTIPSIQSETGSASKSVVRDDHRSIIADNKSVEVKKAPSTHTAAEEKEQPNEMERKLWSLWSSALDLPSSIVRLRDSFFKLGGDSITAMKMASAAREQGLTLTVADVFNNPIFEDMLAAVLATAMSQPTVDECLGQKAIDQPTDNNIFLEQSISSRNTSLLASTYVDSTALQSGICPKIGVFKGGIADVLPVTDFQSLSITATLFKSRWMLNYFYLDGKGPLDLRRLRESCMRVVESFDILRTVFVCMQGQFFQVVLRKLRPNIFVYETEKSMDEFTKSLQQRDRDSEPRQGEQFVQFFVVKKKGSGHHRILIRLSHTQFDGVCLSSIFSALKAAYEGSPLPPTSSFANYMRLLPGTVTPEHYQHWTSLLKGSKMPAIVQREGQHTFQHVGSFTELKRTVDVPSAALGNITMATVMQAAWAMTLAKVCAESDVVFGLTINGRNTTMPGIENTVGPCLNVIPVRVNFEEQWTGLDLFRYLQDQQVANMPYESLGFREIIRHCTDWPDSTFFTTSVFHQNVEYEGQMQLDNNVYRIGGAGVLDSLSDLTVASKQSSPRNLDITLGYSPKSPIPGSFAAKALDMLCETVERLSANPTALLPSPSTLRSLPSQSIIPDHPISEEHSHSSHLQTRNMADILIHSDLLAKTWKQVLPSPATTATSPKPNTTPPQPDIQPFQLNSSFFDLGGDIFAMAQLSWLLLDQEGLHIHIEDLLSHPTFLGQMTVLALHYRSAEGGADRADGGSAAAAAADRNGSGDGNGAAESADGMAQSEEGKISGNRRAWGKAVSLARRFTRRRVEF